MASQFAFIVNVLVNAFFSAYQPQLYKYLSNLNEENKFRMLQIKYLFAIFLLLSTIALCLVVPFAYKWFINKDYYSGIKYVAWNAFGFFFWGLYAMLLGILYYYKKNSTVIIISICSALLCIGLNYFFVKQYGVIGACYANLITYATLFIIVFITAGKLVNLQLSWPEFKKIFNRR